MNSINITHEQARLLVDALWLLKCDDGTTEEQIKAADEILEVVDKLT
jgi:hypothetical protein